MMPAYLITLDRENSGYGHLNNGADAMVVFAASATAAKEIAAAKYDGDGAAWATEATATEIVQDADFNGWAFKVEILGGFGAGNADPASVEVTGDATTNTIDEIGAALVTALNALTGIAGAAYNATSNTLTIAETTDGLGDQAVQVTITPPNGKSGIPSLVGAITDEGASGAALSVVLPADAAVIPIVTAAVKQVE